MIFTKSYFYFPINFLMSYYSVDNICTKFINACEKENFSEFTKLVLNETVQECVIDKLAGKITEDQFIQY